MRKHNPDDPLAAYKHRWYLAHKEAIKQKEALEKAADPEAWAAKEAERNRKHYLKHRTKILTQCAAYKATHHEEILVRDRLYWATNADELNQKRREKYAIEPEPVQQSSRKSYQKHREKRTKENKQWAEKHPKEVRTIKSRYKKKHPEQVRLDTARRRARKLELPDTFTIEQRQFMLQYWHHACAICGNQDGFFWTLADDHWIPIASPNCPGTVADNMIPLCDGQGGCNSSKNDKEPLEWLATRFTPAQTKRILKSIETYFALVRQRLDQTAAD